MLTLLLVCLAAVAFFIAAWFPTTVPKTNPIALGLLLLVLAYLVTHFPTS